jgi:hypothetical protein
MRLTLDWFDHFRKTSTDLDVSNTMANVWCVPLYFDQVFHGGFPVTHACQIRCNFFGPFNLLATLGIAMEM